MDTTQDFIERIITNVEQVIIGKREAIQLIMVAMLCEGHVLIEDVPGVGKTMLARSIATSLGGQFKRLQCTPDLLPNDITGVSVFNQQTSAFEFRPGPVFVNILLADEINRATPRTQSALLEAMQEQQVTMDGTTRPLPRPFLVLATQNPIEYEGTFPLPEAQLDRFLMRITIGYPAVDDERILFTRLQYEHPINKLGQVANPDELLSHQRAIHDIYVDPTLQDYILNLISASRNHADLILGGSPRASLALFKAAQAYAAICGRDHVLPEDIKYLTVPTLIHRIIIRPESELRGKTTRMILTEILKDSVLPIGSKSRPE